MAEKRDVSREEIVECLTIGATPIAKARTLGYITHLEQRCKELEKEVEDKRHAIADDDRAYQQLQRERDEWKAKAEKLEEALDARGRRLNERELPVELRLADHSACIRALDHSATAFKKRLDKIEESIKRIDGALSQGES